MKALISIALLLISLSVQAQTSHLQALKTDTLQKDTIIKNVSYKLYKGVRGGKYIIVVSKASGKEYKRYFKN